MTGAKGCLTLESEPLAWAHLGLSEGDDVNPLCERAWAATAVALLVLLPFGAGARAPVAANNPVNARSVLETSSNSADGLDNEEAEAADWQRRISPVTQKLFAALAKNPQFSGAAFDNSARSVRVYGKSEPSTESRRAMSDARGEGLTVDWIRTEYSGLEFAALSDELMAEPDVNLVELLPVFNGVLVGSPSADSAEFQDRIRAIVESRTPGAQIVFETTIVNVLADRTTDTSPFSGGARLFNATGTCSSGFRAYRDGNPKMLTANHCTRTAAAAGGVSGVNSYLTGNGALIGQSSSIVASGHDVQAINPDGGAYTGQIWVGGCCANTSKYSITGGTGFMAIDEIVCVSGAFSGSQCGTVRATSASYDYCATDGAPCATASNQVAIGDDEALAGQGDSGGPAYQTSGTGTVNVAGMIGAGNGAHPATCLGLGNRNCYSRIYISAWFRFKDAFTTPLTLSP